MDTQLIALDPHGLAAAQTTLIEWCDGKLSAIQTEITQAHGIAQALRKANMSDARARRLVTGINKRAAFYSKIKVALNEGYYILPPIPHQTFAIRSKREFPLRNEAIGSKWKADEPKAQILPVGEGEFHNATVEREVVNYVTMKENGKDVEKSVEANVSWKEIEFPFFPVKPEIIEATSKALAMKVFDWLGAAPPYRSTDPMIIGCIKHYKQYQGPVHFFVAWWLDLETL